MSPICTCQHTLLHVPQRIAYKPDLITNKVLNDCMPDYIFDFCIKSLEVFYGACVCSFYVAGPTIGWNTSNRIPCQVQDAWAPGRLDVGRLDASLWASGNLDIHVGQSSIQLLLRPSIIFMNLTSISGGIIFINSTHDYYARILCMNVTSISFKKRNFHQQDIYMIRLLFACIQLLFQLRWHCFHNYNVFF